MKTMLMAVAMVLSVSGIAVAEGNYTTDEFGNTYPAATVTVPAATNAELQSQLNAANAELYELRLRLKTQENRVAELSGQVAALSKENATLKERAIANAKANPVKPAQAAAKAPEKVVYADIIAGMPVAVAQNQAARAEYIRLRVKGNIVMVTGTVVGASADSIGIRVAGFKDVVGFKLKNRLAPEKIASFKYGDPITVSGLCNEVDISHLEQQ